jgi:hypothetical protein
MLRVLPLLTAVPLVLAYGIGAGLWTDRWGRSEAPAQAAARLRDVPLSVGPWQGRPRELDARQAERAEVSGSLLCDYVHAETGATLTVLLVCGRPGPIALHPPDVCCRGAGYIPAGAIAHLDVPAEAVSSASFSVARFKKSGPIPEPLRVFWSWSADGNWLVPANPRFQFGRAAALYKLYVIRSLPSLEEPLEKDPSQEFLRLFLPEIARSLFAHAEDA